jgi:hypothetical protein
MARTSLKVISVYLNDKDYKTVSDASAKEDRSMSNFLKLHGVAAAKQILDEVKASKKAARAGS